MKKFCLTILTLFITITTHAADLQGVFGRCSPDAYCTSCPDAAKGADQVCEQPDGTIDGLCGWAITETGGATGDVNFAASPDNNPALGCADIPMTYAITFTKTNTDDGSMYASLVTSPTANYVQFYLKINASGLGFGNSFSIFALSEADLDPSVWIFLIENSDGVSDLRLYILYHILAGWQIMGNSDATIPLDTWIGVRLKVLDPAGGGSDSVQWWIDYNNDGVFSDEQTVESLTLDRAIENAVFGVIDPQSGHDKIHTYTITGVKIDDDTMPSGCAR